MKLLQTNIAIRRKNAGLKTHLAGEKERRRTAEKKSAKLQEHFNTRSNELDEFAGEKERRKAAEDHVAMLQDVLEIMSKAFYSVESKVADAGRPTHPTMAQSNATSCPSYPSDGSDGGACSFARMCGGLE